MESINPIGLDHGESRLSGTERVVRVLRDRIKVGDLRFGETLPSERRLSEQLGVGRTIVRGALAELDREGIVRRSGPHQRTVIFNRNETSPPWLRSAVIVLTQPAVISGPAAVRNKWLKYTTLGTVEYLHDSGIPSLMLGATDDAHLADLAAAKPRGVLIPELKGNAAEVLRISSIFGRSGVPVVCYGGDPELASVDRVASDHEAGSYALTMAMLAKGAKRIVRSWPQPWDRYWFVGRSAGYERATRESGLGPLPVAEFPSVGGPTADRRVFDYAVKQVAGFLLPLLREGRPDALLLSTDRDVAYTAAALRLHGLEPGRDVLLAGYDNYWSACEERAFEPYLPDLTVDKRNELAGKMMVDVLLDRVAGNLPPGPQVRVCEQSVIVPRPVDAVR